MTDDHKVTFGTLQPDGRLTNVRTLSNDAIRACPHAIFMPEHYRNDGSCKCDDAGESVMGEWGYTWDANAGRWT